LDSTKRYISRLDISILAYIAPVQEMKIVMHCAANADVMQEGRVVFLEQAIRGVSGCLMTQLSRSHFRSLPSSPA
jgi:hypothetical protein